MPSKTLSGYTDGKHVMWFEKAQGSFSAAAALWPWVSSYDRWYRAKETLTCYPRSPYMLGTLKVSATCVQALMKDYSELFQNAHCGSRTIAAGVWMVMLTVTEQIQAVSNGITCEKLSTNMLNHRESRSSNFLNIVTLKRNLQVLVLLDFRCRKVLNIPFHKRASLSSSQWVDTFSL